jgi:SAM-dependent methyltransferase
MELYELVAMRNQLEPLTAKTAKLFADRELNKILYWIDQLQGYSTSVTIVTDKIKNLTVEFNSIDSDLSLLKTQLDASIRISEQQLYLDTYKYYVLSENRETPQEIENSKHLKISDDDRNLYLARINLYAKWQYPGLIIRPGIENFIDLLVSYQPLYIADHNQELLTMATKKFNDIFQQRLRQYVIRDFEQTPSLSALPDQQFGLCFVYGYFNFRPIEFIVDYLEQLYTKLKAGGVVIFTFNDCDWPEAVKLAQQHASTYVPGRTLKNAARSIGYQIEFEHTNQGASTWIELKKPGTLTSLKAAPTLAKIVELPK